MTAVTPGREELAVACIRRLARCNIENPGQREMAGDDILSTLQKIEAIAPKPSDDPDSANERRAQDDARLASNVREACAKLLEARADGYSGHLSHAIFDGLLVAEELRSNASEIREKKP
jgi:hypothetical protein